MIMNYHPYERDTNEYQIEKGIPLPVPHKKGKYSPLTTALKSLEIGDSFLIPDRHRGGLAYRAKNLKIKLTTQRQPDGTVRLWRIK